MVSTHNYLGVFVPDKGEAIFISTGWTLSGTVLVLGFKKWNRFLEKVALRSHFGSTFSGKDHVRIVIGKSL